MADIDADTEEKVSDELGDQVLFCLMDVTSYSQQVDLFRKAALWGENRLDLFAANAGIADTQFLQEKDYHYDKNGLPLPLDIKVLDVN
ncbi:hypothetical protein N7490_008320 [Penicillium lividum]|nr:hypothetical protein N7490_008320 [Penicillium lividum]